LADRKKISETEIKAIVQAEIANADGYDGTIVSSDRSDNFSAYMGRPYGNEVTGRSQVVSRDVQQTVEWQMPSYMRIFTSGEDVVSFEPSSADNVDMAKQATEYVNYIWNSDNHGFRILYEWIKDALISKVGIIKIYWDDTPKTKRKRFAGLDNALFAEAAAPDDVEVSEHTENKDGTHDLVLTHKKSGGKVTILNVPPEEFLISKGGRTIEDARLVGHGRYRTISDLRKEGYPEDKIKDLAGGDSRNSSGAEEATRNTVEDSTSMAQDTALDPAMRTVRVIEAYIKIDVDGDGIAEMRKVTVAGPGYTVLSNEAWEGPRPFATITPIIMPHRFWGLCPADTSKDTQLVKTTILRQMLDNAYLSINQREEVDASRIVDPDELLSSAPGRKIRVKPGNGLAINPISVPNVMSECIALLDYLDRIDEANTGVSERTQGLSSDTLSNETKAQSQMLMSAAMGKQELMARTMAETGLKSAFRLILKLVCMYQKQPRSVRLSGGWTDVNASDWDEDMELKVSVGLGMGDREHMLMAAGAVGNTQKMLLPLGYTTPENIKNAVELGLNGLGLKGVERFATFPDGDAAKQPIRLPPPGQKPGPDPQVEMAKAQAAAQSKVQVAQITAQAKAATDTHQNQMELQRHTMENRQEMALARFKAQMEAQIELAIAHIKADAQIETARVTAEADAGDDDVAYHRSKESV
jgi:hypothetical protein